ncbi:MAG: four-carbon acid sugar kinase family protein, partial [Planctomycetia bacterium]|nr:four-carbon acid sugar kinase family protein [Planctomycetia bacterium]
MTDDARPLLTFYGDDFTGSTDAMEALARSGVRAALFLDAPGPGQLTGRFAGLKAVGVAGMARSMSPGQMDTALPPVFERLGRLGAKLLHYKVCSTFDSSPEVGSIGRAIDIGRRTFASPFVPLVVGAPALRRYCLFGNLFATAGGETFRLDRHPTMRCHPVTPMAEADLRAHLARQTSK